MNRIVFILIGAPGAGKSTWAKKQSIHLIKIDEKRRQVMGNWVLSPSKQVKEEAFKLAIKEAKIHLSKGQSIIWDGTNIKKVRGQIVNSLVDYADAFIAIVFTTPLRECLRRNKQRKGCVDKKIVIDRFNSIKDNSVTHNEGFDSILFI